MNLNILMKKYSPKYIMTYLFKFGYFEIGNLHKLYLEYVQKNKYPECFKNDFRLLF